MTLAASVKVICSLLSLKLHAFTINGSGRTCDKVCFQHQTMTESVLVKLQGFPIIGNERFSDGVCFWLQTVRACF